MYTCHLAIMFVGLFQVGLEKMATEHTRLIYMTTGVLLQKLVGAKSLTEYSHIFIDEVTDTQTGHHFKVVILNLIPGLVSRY